MGAGTLTLSGANTYTGATTVNAGTLRAGSDTATFNGAGNGNVVIDVATGGPLTINTIAFDTAGAAAYTIGSGAVGTQTLTLDDTAAVTMNGPVTVAGVVGGGSGTVTVAAGKQLTVNNNITNIDTLTIDGQLVTAATATPGTLEETTVVKDVAIAGTLKAPTGQWDIKGGKFIVDYPDGGPSAFDKTFAWVKAGLNLATEGGFWDGNGIMSSTAAADPDSLRTVGVIDNDYEGTAVFPTDFGGQPVDISSVLGMYTYFGDALLEGDVTGLSYAMIDNGYNVGLTGWINGDFNYDGVVDGVDYAIIDNVYNTLHPPGPGGGVSAIPEPATLSLLTLGGMGMLLRRRRK